MKRKVRLLQWRHPLAKHDDFWIRTHGAALDEISRQDTDCDYEVSIEYVARVGGNIVTSTIGKAGETKAQPLMCTGCSGRYEDRRKAGVKDCDTYLLYNEREFDVWPVPLYHDYILVHTTPATRSSLSCTIYLSRMHAARAVWDYSKHNIKRWKQELETYIYNTPKEYQWRSFRSTPLFCLVRLGYHPHTFSSTLSSHPLLSSTHSTPPLLTLSSSSSSSSLSWSSSSSSSSPSSSPPTRPVTSSHLTITTPPSDDTNSKTQSVSVTRQEIKLESVSTASTTSTVSGECATPSETPLILMGSQAQQKLSLLQKGGVTAICSHSILPDSMILQLCENEEDLFDVKRVLSAVDVGALVFSDHGADNDLALFYSLLVKFLHAEDSVLGCRILMEDVLYRYSDYQQRPQRASWIQRARRDLHTTYSQVLLLRNSDALATLCPSPSPSHHTSRTSKIIAATTTTSPCCYCHG